MSRISSNTYFHFTKFENLIGILEHNFYPRYCSECTYTSDGNTINFSFPIVCFCDIPLSQISNHIKHYGNYGIGLSKEWVLRNRLNPIIYLQKQSYLSKKLELVLNSNWESVNALPIKQLLDDRDALIYLLMHIKPYEGMQIRNGNKESIRFYDEREWRYIPDISRLEDEELHLLTEKYSDEQIKRKNDLLKEYPLKFEPNDIKYIIIKSENERKDVIKKISEIKSSKSYSFEDIQLLTSKIITVEQINEDF